MTTLQELVAAFEAANASASDADNLHGNPQLWGVVRGIKAVAALEREACAQIAERMGYEGDFDDEGSRIAKAIRTQAKE